jgi:hypothetical protein
MLYDPLRFRGLERKTGQPPTGTAVIDVAPSLDRLGEQLPSKFDAFLGPRTATTTPFCCLARALMKLGLAVETILIMQRRGSDIESLRAPINTAAYLTVREDRCDTRFSAWKAMGLGAAGAPIALPYQHGPTFNSMED